MKASDDMIEGYRDGMDDTRFELPESLANRSHSYRHGWQMACDDRSKLSYDPYRAGRNRIDANNAMMLDGDALAGNL